MGEQRNRFLQREAHAAAFRNLPCSSVHLCLRDDHAFPQDGKNKSGLFKELKSVKPDSGVIFHAQKQEAAGTPGNTVPFELATRLSMAGNRIEAGNGIGKADAAEEIYKTNYPTDKYFAVRGSGDAMYPKTQNGDTLILKRTETVEDGNIAAYYIGNDETPIIREVHIDEDGMLILIAVNSRVVKTQFL